MLLFITGFMLLYTNYHLLSMPYDVKCLASSKRATFVKTRFAENGPHMCGLGDVDAWVDLAPITFFALSFNEVFFSLLFLSAQFVFFLYYFEKTVMFITTGC